MVFFSLIANSKLDLKMHFPDDTLLLSNQFIFRRPYSEDHHIDSLLTTIYQHYHSQYSFQIEKVGSGSGNRDCFCEYTGGGDIYIHKVKGASLSIMDIDLAVPCPNPTESLTTLNIEGKKADFDDSKLANQLKANTILCCVTQFVRECREKQVTWQFLKKLERLSGYGVGITGMGHFDFIKLVMDFKEGSYYFCKHEQGERAKPLMAALVDQALDYYFKEVNQ